MRKWLNFIIFTVFCLLFCVPVLAQEEQGQMYYDLGVFAYEDKDYEAAAENFIKALSYNPEDAHYNHYLGKTYLDMAAYAKSERYLAKAMGLDPNIEGLMYDYAFLNYKTANYEKSADLFATIVEKDPSNILAQYHGGISLYETKSYKEALDYFLNASAQSPTIKANGYFYAGVCYRQIGKDKEAVEMFEYVKNNADAVTLREQAIKWLDAIEAEKKLLKPYNLYVKLGYQYDDNVRLEPLDESDLYADEDDFLIVGLFSGKYNFVNKRKYKVGAGLSYYQKSHNELSLYDLMAGIANLFVKYRFDKIMLGLDYLPSQYWVDSEEYLLQHQVRPELTWYASSKFVAKLSASYFNKDHLQDDDRDSNAWELGLSNYYSFFNGKGALFAGIGYESNDASFDDYDYTQLKTKLGLSLTVFKNITLALTGRYRDKNYDNVDSSHLKKREDQKYGGSVSLSSKLFWSWLSIMLEYDYTDNQSNIDIYTYQRSKTTLSLSATF